MICPPSTSPIQTTTQLNVGRKSACIWNFEIRRNNVVKSAATNPGSYLEIFPINPPI